MGGREERNKCVSNVLDITVVLKMISDFAPFKHIICIIFYFNNGRRHLWALPQVPSSLGHK